MNSRDLTAEFSILFTPPAEGSAMPDPETAAAPSRPPAQSEGHMLRGDPDAAHSPDRRTHGAGWRFP